MNNLKDQYKMTKSRTMVINGIKIQQLEKAHPNVGAWYSLVPIQSNPSLLPKHTTEFNSKTSMTTQLFQADPIPSPHPLDPFKCCLYICGRDEEGAKEAVVVDGISCSLSGDPQFQFSAIPSSSCHLKYVQSFWTGPHSTHTHLEWNAGDLWRMCRPCHWESD